jgi:hypothetical protein
MVAEISLQILQREHDKLKAALDSRKTTEGDSVEELSKNPLMTDISREELQYTLSGIEDRMDRRIEQLSRESERRADEYNRELMLRDEFFRRENEIRQETLRFEQELRDKSLDERFASFLTGQMDRDKLQLERDKRYEMLAERVTKAAEGAEEAAKQAATVKSNYWAAVIVQLLAVVAILVGAYYANQANVLGAMQTTMSAFQAGKAENATPISPNQSK